MKRFTSLLLLLSVLSVFGEEQETRLIELEPDEAAQIINKQDQTLNYAPKIESNRPGVRVLGDHPEQVVEDIYLANQYHGQDGLGAYVYGYSVPDIAKTEKKERSGDLRGAYNYIAGDGQEIKVEYWDDGTGFHQIDNVPKIQPKQVEDSPEVKAAKEEHLRIWHEQAERNSHPIADPYASSQYNQPQQQQQPYQPHHQAQQSQSVQSQYQQYQGQVSNQPQGPPQPYPAPSYPQAHPGPNQPSQGHYQPQSAPSGGQSHTQVQHTAGYQQQQGSYSQQSAGGSQDYSGQYSSKQQTWAKGPGGSAAAGPAGSYGGQGSAGGYGSGAAEHAGSYGGQGSAGGYGSGAAGHAGSYGGQGSAGSGGAGSGSGASGHAGSYGGQGSGGGYSSGEAGSGSGGAGHGGNYGGQGSAGGYGSGGAGAGSYGSSASGSQKQQAYASRQDQQEEEEEQGPPKGFFYSFNYPVGIIVGREGKNLEAYYSQNKQAFEKQLAGEAPRPQSASSSYHAST